MKEKIIVGISGASGMPVAAELMRQLHKNSNMETHSGVSMSFRYFIIVS